MHLHAAAARGDQTGIRYALAQGTDINAVDVHGCTVLHHALAAIVPAGYAGVPRASVDTIELLIKKGASLKAKDFLGRQAIHLAAGLPDLTILDLLERHGASLRQITGSGYTTLVSAAYQRPGPGKLRMLGRLIASGVDKDLASIHGESPLSVCQCMGDFASLRYLLESGAEPSPLAWTPLHRAVAFGSRDEVATLAGSPAAINDPVCRFGLSPWLLAIRIGDLGKMELLAERGADLLQQDRRGRSALHIAAETDSPALAWLLGYGAAVSAVDHRGDTPLHTAAEADAPGAVRQLLAAGANIDQENYFQIHPIHPACSLAVLSLLTESGANLNAIDGCGEWPLKNAVGDPERVAWLLAHGAKPDLTSTGATALHDAVQADAREVIVHLLEAGANPNAQDVDGWTPFFHARSRETIHLLRRAGGDPQIRDQCGGLPAEWLKDPVLQAALSEPLPR